MIIYNNYDSNYTLEEARTDYKEHLIDMGNTEAEALETIALDNNVYCFIAENQDMIYEDEYNHNLNVEINSKLIAIANIGRWNGRRCGYKELSYNLNSIFECWESCDYIKLYSEHGNIKGIGAHHDGTNYVTFRKLIDNITDSQLELLENAIYENAGNVENYIKRYTRSIYKDVKKIYG